MRRAWRRTATILPLVLLLTGCVISPAPVSPPVVPELTEAPHPEPTHSDAWQEGVADFWENAVGYDVQSDGGLVPQPTGLAATVWSVFERIADRDVIVDELVQFVVVDSEQSGLYAMVSPSVGARGDWVLAVNLDAVRDDEQLRISLIHEYAHLLTLREGQLVSDPRCPALQTGQGCTAPGSYLEAFHRRFWQPYGNAAPAPDQWDQDVADAWYAAHPYDFISSYAATNIVEDIAVSFTGFVVWGRPDGRGEVWEDKTGFFWDYPELVELRERLRAEFAGELTLD